MPRFFKIAGVLAATCLLPVLALNAQAAPSGVARRAASGQDRRHDGCLEAVDRPDRADQGRGAQALASHGDLELPDRRDRASAHRFAQHEAGERVDARQAGRVGRSQRPPRGVGAVRSRLVAQAVLGAGDRAPVHPVDRLPQGMVARHRWHADGQGRLFRRQDRGRFRRVQREAQRGDRADQPDPRGRSLAGSRWPIARPIPSCSCWPTRRSPPRAAWAVAEGQARDRVRPRLAAGRQRRRSGG